MVRNWRALLLPLSAALLVAGGSTVPVAAAAPAATSITVNGTATGRTFDGIGAISGGGGNSRLLINYPEPERGQILDYLFTPGYGADLQILKVEIGGDTNSTDGAESSIEHTAGTVNCDTGYEWWLMAQAKARNPRIKLYGLAWGAPGWIGGGNFWSADTINYLISWLGCASSHGLTIDYLGGWNERGYNKTWYENLRTALNSHGYGQVQVVGADSDWGVADDMVSDQTFANSISIVGAHYPCAGGDGGTADTCSTTANALATGKPLWASENGSQDDTSGAPALIRSILRGYTDAKFTAYINWPLLAAIYPNLGYDTTGLMVANEPWSGNYTVGADLWATAQVTQFTQPGWRFLDSASGYLGGAESNGSYVSLAAPNGTDYSTILETTTATAAQTATFTVTGGLSTGPLHVWSTNLNSTNPADYFVHDQDVTPVNGQFTLTLQPGEIYSLSTVGGQGRSGVASPPQATMPLPFADNYDSDSVGSQPVYLSDQNGSFEVRPCAGGRSGNCVRQMAATAPISWDTPSNPYTLFGDLGWTDYTVSADALLEQPGAVQLLGRVGTQRPFSVSGLASYYLQVGDTGAWSIVKNTTDATLTTLSSSTTTALGTGTWHHLALSFQGSTITAALDGRTLGTATDTSYASGQVGLGENGWQTDDFDNFAVTPIGAQHVSATYQLINRASGQVLDVSGSAATQDPNTGSASQQWQLFGLGTGEDTLVNAGTGQGLTASGPNIGTATPGSDPSQQWLVQASGGYYTVTNAQTQQAATGAGSSVVGQPADGSAAQQWSLALVPVAGASYVLTNKASGMVMDVNGESTSDGAQIIQWPYHGGTNERWTLRPAGSGAFTLVGVASGKVLDVTGQSTSAGTALELWTANGGPNQQWLLHPQADGDYTLTGVQSGLDADVTGGSTAEGAQLVQEPASGAASQEWRLTLVS